MRSKRVLRGDLDPLGAALGVVDAERAAVAVDGDDGALELADRRAEAAAGTAAAAISRSGASVRVIFMSVALPVPGEAPGNGG